MELIYDGRGTKKWGGWGGGGQTKKMVGKQQDVNQKGTECFLRNHLSLSAQNMENGSGMAMNVHKSVCKD